MKANLLSLAALVGVGSAFNQHRHLHSRAVHYIPNSGSSMSQGKHGYDLTSHLQIGYKQATQPAASTPPPPPAQPASSSSSGNAGGSGLGVVYSPYNADNSCKSADQVHADFSKIQGYHLTRLYGTDCDQVGILVNQSRANSMKVFLGIWDINKIEDEVEIIINSVGDDWSVVDTISVGNELLNKGISAESIVAAVERARGLLRNARYQGPVVAVDTWNAILANPSVCQCSDYVAANTHAFFDGNVEAADAGKFVKQAVQRMSDACGKRVVVTESGWPRQGGANNKAVASPANQQAAIASLKSQFSADLILFSAFDDLWKKDFDGSFGCERFWGFIQ